jgi:hypothetical protein
VTAAEQGGGGALRKVRQRYVNVPSTLARDSRLTFKARGVLLYLLDKPDGWQVRSHAIAADGPDGRLAVLSALRELAALGYYRRVQTRDTQTGRLATWTEVSDVPVPGWIQTRADDLSEVTKPDSGQNDQGESADTPDTPDLSQDRFPDAGRPHSGRPHSGHPHCGRPDPGQPDPGRPDSGSRDALTTTESNHRGRKNFSPIPPAAPRPGDGYANNQPPTAPTACSKTDRPHRNCRGCGTTRRATRQQAEQPPAPPVWCGVCDEATRMRDSADGRTVARCPGCHPGMVARAG